LRRVSTRKTVICVVSVALGTSPYTLSQTGRATKGDESLPASGTVRLYVTPVLIADKSLAGLIRAADVVIDGTVESVLPARQPSPTNLETDVRVAIWSVIKGPLASKEIMVSQMGGAVGALKIVPQGYDLMQPGERYVLFLKRDMRPSTPQISGVPAYLVLGAWLGQIRVSNNVIDVSRSPGLLQYSGSNVGAFEAEAAQIADSVGARN
jgi:hypothetical protein